MFSFLFRHSQRHILILLSGMPFFLPFLAYAQHTDRSAILKAIDMAVERRETDLAGYTTTEHYAAFRNGDTAHPAAQMTVKATYRKESGKSYQILSESGSELLRKEVLERMLEDEHSLTQPANRARAVIDSNNYAMSVKNPATIDGRPCVLLQIVPRHAARYLFKGSLWVDARNGSIVRLEGTTAKPVSIIAGPTHVSRQYTMIEGFPVATHATASTSVMLLGQIEIAIDYSNYALDFRRGGRAEPADVSPAK